MPERLAGEQVTTVFVERFPVDGWAIWWGMAVVKINAIEVPEGAGEELERRFAARQGAVENAPGFLGFELLRPVAGENRYFVYTRWESEAAFRAWADGPGRQAHAGGQGRAVASGASLLEFEVVQQAAAAAGS